ncbi:MAG: hypothetical protein WCG85_12120 [Polyangia bacterium]
MTAAPRFPRGDWRLDETVLDGTGVAAEFLPFSKSCEASESSNVPWSSLWDATLRRTNVVLSFAIGSLLFGECYRLRKSFPLAGVIVGVFLIL